jgi:hypothetical protein
MSFPLSDLRARPIEDNARQSRPFLWEPVEFVAKLNVGVFLQNKHNGVHGLTIGRVICARTFFKRASWIILLAASAATSAAAVFSADSVKAAFLYRFAAYIEWPEDAPGESFVIGVAGSDGVVDQLESLLPRVSVHGHSAVVRRVTRAADLDGVHVLYVGQREFKNTRALRTAALDKPILIVTDEESGLDGGAVINFLQGDRTVRFEISLIAADRAHLKIDAALLAVAERVERRPLPAQLPLEARP